MSRKTPVDPLRGQVETLVEAVSALERWFRRPEPAVLSAARTARLRARGWREAAVESLRGGRGPAKADASDLSFALCEAVEHSSGAAADAALWGVGADASFAAMAGELRESCLALSRAAGVSGEARAAALVEAKRLAAAVERRRRAERAAARDSIHLVDSIKRSELASRLSAAAEAVQQACDALAGSLAQ